MIKIANRRKEEKASIDNSRFQEICLPRNCRKREISKGKRKKSAEESGLKAVFMAFFHFRMQENAEKT